MNKLLQPGRIIFSLGIIALGILSLVMRDFIVARPPEWPVDMGGKIVWAYLASTIAIVSAVAILVRKKAMLASFAIGIIIIISFLIRHFPALLGSSGEAILWTLNAYKTLALAGGAFIVAISFIEEDNLIAKFKYTPLLLWVSVVFLSFFLVMCGFGHFKFADFVIGYIPEYIPFRPFWTYFCGVCLIAGGLGILIQPVRRLAAVLSGFMILGWFLLLHIPRVAATPADAGERMGLFESFTLVGVFFVLSYLYLKANRRMS